VLQSGRPATDFKTESILLKHLFSRHKSTKKRREIFADSISILVFATRMAWEPWRALYFLGVSGNCSPCLQTAIKWSSPSSLAVTVFGNVRSALLKVAYELV
jgi:hypothetical protein